MKTVLVVAPSLNYFLRHAWGLRDISGHVIINSGQGKAIAVAGDVEYRYMSSPDHMRGKHGVVTEFWGPVDDMDNIEEFRRVARAIRFSL